MIRSPYFNTPSVAISLLIMLLTLLHHHAVSGVLDTKLWTNNCTIRSTQGKGTYCRTIYPYPCLDGTQGGDPGQCEFVANDCLDPVTPQRCTANQVFRGTVVTSVDQGIVTPCYYGDLLGIRYWVRNNYTTTCCNCPAGYISQLIASVACIQPYKHPGYECARCTDPNELLTQNIFNFSSLCLPPSCFNMPSDACNFYDDCLTKKYPCDTSLDYGKVFGKKFCEITVRLAPILSQTGKVWLSNFRLCLMQSFAPVLRSQAVKPYYTSFDSIPVCTANVQFGYSTHLPCYVKSKFCSIPLRDMGRILYLLREEFFPFDALKQGWTMVTRCLSNSTGFDNRANYASADYVFRQPQPGLNTTPAGLISVGARFYDDYVIPNFPFPKFDQINVAHEYSVLPVNVRVQGSSIIFRFFFIANLSTNPTVPRELAQNLTKKFQNASNVASGPFGSLLLTYLSYNIIPVPTRKPTQKPTQKPAKKPSPRPA